MNKTVTVTFDGRGLHPDSALNLKPNKRYRIQIISEEQLPAPPKENAWDILESLADTFEAPEDWSIHHDHYLYRTPKRN
ncbi:MAG: hypothetical protein QNJ68_00130 [Microcoleaceae cyanobacterium MO_207.B10]|nr:hypothetical protein [Microcoleaceae cyanobacterium MO_207.B10]